VAFFQKRVLLHVKKNFEMGDLCVLSSQDACCGGVLSFRCGCLVEVLPQLHKFGKCLYLAEIREVFTYGNEKTK
jgi:hypothetical protein